MLQQLDIDYLDYNLPAEWYGDGTIAITATPARKMCIATVIIINGKGQQLAVRIVAAICMQYDLMHAPRSEK